MINNPNSGITKNIQSQYLQKEEITKLLRDATIRYAIKTDNTKILDDLDKLGAKPTEKFSDGKSPDSLLTASNKNVKAWFDSKLKPSAVQLGNNPHAFLSSSNASSNSAQLLRDLEDARDKLDIEHLEAVYDLRQASINSEMEYARKLAAIYKAQK